MCDLKPIPISFIYFPPRFNVNCQEFKNFFKFLWPRFIVGGYFNAKDQWWGWRVQNPKGIELSDCVIKNNYTVLSTESPNYWPTDSKRNLDLVEFFVYSGISNQFLKVSNELCDELSSDHSPTLLNFNTLLQHVKNISDCK